MSAATSINKAYSYKTSPHKTPKLKEPTPASCSYGITKDSSPHPILMDEFGQTPDHYYLAKKTPSSYQVKRKLDLQNSSSNGNQKANQRRPRRKACSSVKSKTKTDKPRYDTSLGQLTKKFLILLSEATDGVINLNTACNLLSVPKRRLYDITNVLEGAGLIQKTSRNNIQWTAKVPSNIQKYDLEREIDILEAKENKLDELIYHMKREINSIKEKDEKFHYLTGEDLVNIEANEKRLILGVNLAPSVQIVEKTETTLVIKSQTTEINAHFLSNNILKKIVDPELEDSLCESYSIRIDKNNMLLPSDVYKASLEEISIGQVDRTYNYFSVPLLYVGLIFNAVRSLWINSERVKEAMCSENEVITPDILVDGVYVSSIFSGLDDEDPHIKSVFITEEDDIAPMGKHFLLQTEDQDLMQSFHLDNYSFSLDNGEGITDLYDCVYP